MQFLATGLKRQVTESLIEGPIRNDSSARRWYCEGREGCGRGNPMPRTVSDHGRIFPLIPYARVRAYSICVKLPTLAGRRRRRARHRYLAARLMIVLCAKSLCSGEVSAQIDERNFISLNLAWHI